MWLFSAHKNASLWLAAIHYNLIEGETEACELHHGKCYSKK
jgi:hypothetical protein